MIELNPTITVIGKRSELYEFAALDGNEIVEKNGDRLSLKRAKSIIFENTTTRISAEQIDILGLFEVGDVYTNQYGTKFSVLWKTGPRLRIVWLSQNRVLQFQGGHAPGLVFGRYSPLDPLSPEEIQGYRDQDPEYQEYE